jgi:hypothetical protein
LNKRLIVLEQNYENAFLVASGDTVKDLSEYSELRSAVEAIINAREEKEQYLSKQRIALKQIRLVTEASDVMLQMYLSLKQTSKIMDQVNYDWDMYINLLDNLMGKLVQKLKKEAHL